MNVIAILVLGLVLILFGFFINAGRGGNERKADPLGQAGVYLAYGRKKEAIALLENHLKQHPGDPKALALLEEARK